MLGSERAAYGEQIVVTVSGQLVVDYGRGYSEKNLRRMVQFAELFPEQEIVATLSRQLSWSHFGVPAATVQKFTLRNVFLASLEFFSGQNWPKPPNPA